jgi:hypothetical protein
MLKIHGHIHFKNQEGRKISRIKRKKKYVGMSFPWYYLERIAHILTTHTLAISPPCSTPTSTVGHAF